MSRGVFVAYGLFGYFVGVVVGFLVWGVWGVCR